MSGYGEVTAAADVAVTIAENDTEGVAVTPTGLTVLEGGRGSYTVVLESEPAGTVTVTAAVPEGTDVTVSPQRLTFTADDWSEPREVTVRAAEDADALADAEVTVRHAVSGYGAVTAAAVTVTIQENDTAGVVVTPTALTVPEGGSGSYTVALVTQPDGTVTVTPAVPAGTDADGESGEPDVHGGQLERGAGGDAASGGGRRRGSRGGGDGEARGERLRSGDHGGGRGGDDQEKDTAGVVVTPTGLTVPEGGSGGYTVVLESEPAGEVTVTAAVAAGTDVTVTPEILRFTADNWSVAQEVTVRAAEDADALADAEVTVRHAVSGYGAVTTAADGDGDGDRRTTRREWRYRRRR